MTSEQAMHEIIRELEKQNKDLTKQLEEKNAELNLLITHIDEVDTEIRTWYDIFEYKIGKYMNNLDNIRKKLYEVVE